MRKENFSCVSSVCICGSKNLRDLQNVLDPANWNEHPVGTVIQFVSDFVHSFIEQIGFQHDLKILAVVRHENCPRGCLKVTLQKHAAGLAIPEISPAL